MSCTLVDASRAVRAAHTFAAIIKASRLGLEQVGFGPQPGSETWRVVFTDGTVSVWAHGITDGTLALSLFVNDPEAMARALRDMSWSAVVSTASRGEVRLSGLTPIAATAVVERAVRTHAATSSAA